MTVALVPSPSVPPTEDARKLADLVLGRLADLELLPGLVPGAPAG